MIKISPTMAGVIACLVLILSPGSGRSAEPGDSLSVADTLSAVEKGHWVGFPIAFYTPETGFGGGAAAGYIFPRNGERHPSSLMGIGFYTEKKQTMIALAPELYLEGGFHGLLEAGYQLDRKRSGPYPASRVVTRRVDIHLKLLEQPPCSSHAIARQL